MALTVKIWLRYWKANLKYKNEWIRSDKIRQNYILSRAGQGRKRPNLLKIIKVWREFALVPPKSNWYSFSHKSRNKWSAWGDYCTYADNMLISSFSMEEHARQTQVISERLQNFRVVINPLKCQFENPRSSFGRHQISPIAISPAPDKTQVNSQFSVPTTMSNC